ncbi:MAG: glycosyltransferase family 4 protein, partial [Planctomycetota bacterium]
MIYFFAAYFFIIAALLSLILIPFAGWCSRKFSILDFPIGRKKHKTPMPLLGGVAVIGAFLLTVAGNLGAKFIYYRVGFLQDAVPEVSKILSSFYISQEGLIQLTVIAAGGILVFIVGLLDDAIFFGIRGRLLSEFAIAILVVYFGIKPALYGVPEPITVLWIVGLTNSFNLIDGMDGMAGGVAFICSVMMTVFCFMTDQIMVGFLLITLCGAIIGFLKSNWHPAKIYLGSCGSLFLGYMLATIPLSVAFMQEGTSRSAIFMPVVILSVPLYDTISVMLIRVWNKRSPFAPDHNHIFHRIQKLGLSVTQVVLLIYLLTFAVGISAMHLAYATLWDAVLILTHLIAMYGVFIILELTGVRFIQRQQLVRYNAVFSFAGEENEEPHKGIIRMLTADGAEVEVTAEYLGKLAYAFSKKDNIQVSIISEEDEFEAIKIESEIKSIWQTADHKGFCGINFIFKNDSEMRQIKSQIAAII